MDLHITSPSLFPPSLTCFSSGSCSQEGLSPGGGSALPCAPHPTSQRQLGTRPSHRSACSGAALPRPGPPAWGRCPGRWGKRGLSSEQGVRIPEGPPNLTCAPHPSQESSQQPKRLNPALSLASPGFTPLAPPASCSGSVRMCLPPCLANPAPTAPPEPPGHGKAAQSASTGVFRPVPAAPGMRCGCCRVHRNCRDGTGERSCSVSH